MELDGNDTTIFLHHPYILCHFANYAHDKTLYMHIGLFTPTKSPTIFVFFFKQ